MKTCWTCHEEKALFAFTRDKSKRDGYSGRCAECSRKANAAANKDKLKGAERQRRYKKAHPERVAARQAADKESSALRIKKWVEENREREKVRIYAKTARRRVKRISATVPWANEFFMREAYDLAKRRTAATGFKWEVDHEYPLQHPDFCGLHVDYNLQVIPASVNRAKGNRVLHA